VIVGPPLLEVRIELALEAAHDDLPLHGGKLPRQ
jgi:hypothetical protein